MGGKCYDVSVVVVTYYSNYVELVKTLYSVIIQKGISLQVIVADDGSEYDYFQELEVFFHKHHFGNFKFVKNKKNVGTVKNVISAVEVCDGKFVKTLGPGDLLYTDETLRNWISEMERFNCVWSFGNYTNYYKNENGQVCLTNGRAYPRNIDAYLKGKREEYRWDYVVNADCCVGAAIICEKNNLLKYLRLIAGKVRYAEDNVYRIMMLQDVDVVYFQEKVIYYEVGNGISTSNDPVWNSRIQNDWNKSNDILQEQADRSNSFQRKMAEALTIVNIKNPVLRKARGVFVKNRLKFKIKEKFHPRIQKVDYRKDEIRQVLLEEKDICR